MKRRVPDKMTPENIIRKIESNKKKIRAYRVKRIGLFGSFLKRNQQKGSDIDILVAFSKPTFDNYMDLKYLLEGILKKKVDLVVETNLKPGMKYVKKEALYAKGL